MITHPWTDRGKCCSTLKFDWFGCDYLLNIIKIIYIFQEGSTEWKSTIIELQSSDVFRLPIADVWINDIHNADQRMSIESIEVCFG